MEKQHVLFLSTENAARSQMAEALLRHHAGDRFDAHSAGLAPTRVHPMTKRVLEEIGIETAGLEAKSLKVFLARMTINYAIVLCERVHRDCPDIYPFAIKILYWPFANPNVSDSMEDQLLQAFRETRDRINEHIQEWLREPGVAFALPSATL